jgi:hypothetical protein
MQAVLFVMQLASESCFFQAFMLYTVRAVIVIQICITDS